jgi:hypothetical protein
MATQSCGHATPGATCRSWLRIAGVLALLTITIVSHGCHGKDVDDELSAAQTPRAEGQSTRPPVGPHEAIAVKSAAPP